MLESVALLSTLFEKSDILDYLALNAPDDLVLGLSAQLITCFFGNSRVENFVGADLTVYEDNDGIAEFSLIQVSVSLDGLALTDVTPSKTSYIAIVGDALHGAPAFARSYVLGAIDTSALNRPRFAGGRFVLAMLPSLLFPERCGS
jgi:hypothetical protein